MGWVEPFLREELLAQLIHMGEALPLPLAV
jgi:hypothetical protein